MKLSSLVLRYSNVKKDAEEFVVVARIENLLQRGNR